MIRLSRRALFSRSSVAAGASAGPASGREIIRARYFPNVALTTHQGKRARFYDDLIKDKIVVINWMYADCEGVCPLITANLVKVQKLLGDRVGRDLFLYSLTLKPQDDTPKQLAAYAAMHHVGPGWLFLTGAPADLELLRHTLGFADIDRAVDRDTSRHSGVLRFGNEPLALWATADGEARPEWIAESISWVTRVS